MKKILLYFCCIAFSSFYSQQAGVTAVPVDPIDPTLVIFQYDDAGNQIYRGLNCLTCCVGCRPGQDLAPPLAEQIANYIQTVPVPVKTDLTVIWDLSIRDYIVTIDLLPYNAFKITESVNVKALSNNSYVFRMNHLPYGVYFLKFNLSDGSVYTRSVTKN